MHYEKFKAGAVGHILKHMDDYKTRAKRENVDEKLICKNVDFLSDDNRLAYQRYKDILSQDKLRILNRSDINTLVSCIVTIPDDFKGDEKQFFKSTFDFLCEQHGKENVVSCVCHYDEPNARAHLHFVFCPVVPDKKRQGMKLCAKECVSKPYLKMAHPKLKAYLEDRLGVPCNVLNGKTAGGNLTIQELRAKTIEKEIEDKTAVVDDYAKEVLRVKGEVQNFISSTEQGQYYLIAKKNKELTEEVNRHRSVLSSIWEQYKGENARYWNNYQIQKETIKTAIKSAISEKRQNERELQKQLYNLYQTNEWLIVKMFRLCVILSLYLKEPRLQRRIDELRDINNELKETARLIVNESKATADALKTQNLELIQKQMIIWEKAVLETNTNIEESYFQYENRKENLDKEISR